MKINGAFFVQLLFRLTHADTVMAEWAVGVPANPEFNNRDGSTISDKHMNI